MAQVIDMGELRGKIFYKENYKTRVVSYVEWLDKHQRLRSVDYYTKKDSNTLKRSMICPVHPY